MTCWALVYYRRYDRNDDGPTELTVPGMEWLRLEIEANRMAGGEQ